MALALRVIVFSIVCIMSAPVDAGSTQTLVFSTSSSATDAVNAYHRFLQKAYAEIGYDVALKRYPVKRSYSQADVEKADGVLIAPASILENYKNLVTVPIPLAQIDLTVYSISKDFQVAGFSSLKEYRIGMLRGYLLSERLTRGTQRQIVDDYRSLFTILQMGRVDVVIALKKETERFLAANPAIGPVRALHPPLLSIPMYHFLNRRHDRLVPLISPVMKRMIDEKVLETLYDPYSVD